MNLNTTLAQLEAAQLVRHLIEEDPAYIFKHALTQATAYESVLKNQRRTIHARVARAYQKLYEQRCADEFAAVLAYHFGEAGDDANALIYATHAGDVAAQMYANQEAIVFYSQALDAAKRANATTAQLIHLYTKRGRVLEVMARNPHALATYQEMAEFARARGDRALELQAVLLQGKLYSIPSTMFDRNKSLAIAEQADSLAHMLSDRKAQAQSLWNRLMLHQYNSEIPDAIRCGEQALAIARDLDARELLGYIMGDLARAYLADGKIDQMATLETEVRAVWRELDNKPMLADNLMQSATLALMRGDYDESIALGDESVEISQATGSQLSLMASQGGQVFPCLDRGDFARALQLVQAIVNEANAIGGYIFPMQSALGAMVFGIVGDFTRGNEMAEQVRVVLQNPFPEFFRAWSWALLARFYLAAGNLNAARDALAASEIEKHPERFDAASLFGVVAQGELLLARGEFNRAAQVMAERVTLLRHLGLRQSLHDALFIQAKAMRALGNSVRAIELLHQAREVSEQMQARRLLWQIYATLSEIENERGNKIEAKNFRAQAREVIEYIIAHTPEEFRAAFLNLPDVRATTG
jgi:tetratricopeptide (TPR) repeat protein